MVRFRRSKKIGPFRVTASKTGLSWSAGGKGLRFGASPKGKPYASASTGGFSKRIGLSGSRGRSGSSASKGAKNLAAGCIGVLVGGGAVMFFLAIVCSGVASTLSPPETTTAAPSEPAISAPALDTAAQPDKETISSPASEADSSPGLQKPSRGVSEPPKEEKLTAHADHPSGHHDDQHSDQQPGPAQPNNSERSDPTELSATASISPVPTQSPELDEEPRTWTDSTGKHSVVATLIAERDGRVLLKKAEGGKTVLAVDRLSKEDAEYVLQATTPRVDVDADLILGEVVEVNDGDTVEVLTVAKDRKKIRLEGIDAPEDDQNFGDEATEHLKSLILGEKVRVEVKELDRYGRYVGTVYVHGVPANLQMVRSGLAWHYTEYSDDQSLAKAETTAKLAKRSLWSEPEQIPPWDWRDGERLRVEAPGDTPSPPSADATTVYVTNTGTKYHEAGCRHLRSSSTPIPLSRAVKSYGACKVCKPPRSP